MPGADDMGGQPYPFVKNRFFPKKRMHRVDFQRDQALAEPGFALDPQGRLVVDEPALRRLRALE